MRVPDGFLDCVVFLGLGNTQGPRPTVDYGGTGFFVEAAPGGSNGRVFLVTAKHVARDLQHLQFFIRGNNKSGKAESFKIDPVKWESPLDTSIDLAIAEIVPPDKLRYWAIPENMLLTKSKMDGKNIGPGDSAYMLGLFRLVRGDVKNIPMVRTGNIALVPDGYVPVADWDRRADKAAVKQVKAYLIESRSIGGFSGSPVLARRTIKVWPAEHSGMHPGAEAAPFLLGVCQGHWDVPDGYIEMLEEATEAVHPGLTIVVPAYQLVDLIEAKWGKLQGTSSSDTGQSL